MRILFVLSTLERHWRGGIGRVVAGLACALAEAGHEVHVAGRARRGEPGVLPGVTLHPWRPGRAKWTQLGPLRRLLRELDPDVVHFHSALPHGAVIVPLLWSRGASPRPAIFATPYTGARSEYAKRLSRAALARVDGVVTNSAWGAERVAAAGAPAARTRVIPAGVALPAAVPAERAPVVAALARLVPSKGIDVLVDAFALVAAARPAWQLHVAGEGREFEALRSRAAGSPAADAIRWRGVLHGEAKQALLSEAAIGVVPSRDDNYPGALLELQAHGIACIASAIGGIPEIVGHGASGRLVPPGDVAALAQALGALMDDPDAREALGAAARKAAEARSFEAVAAAHERAYREVAATRT